MKQDNPRLLRLLEVAALSRLQSAKFRSRARVGWTRLLNSAEQTKTIWMWHC